MAGADVAELYVTTPDAPAAAERPVKRLVGFQKVTLDPGQTKTVTLAVKVADLAFYDGANSKWVVDPGRYGFQIGRSSADVQVQDVVTVAGTLTPKPSVVTAKPVATGDAARDVPTRVLFPVGRDRRPAAHRVDERRHALRLRPQGASRSRCPRG